MRIYIWILRSTGRDLYAVKKKTVPNYTSKRWTTSDILCVGYAALMQNIKWGNVRQGNHFNPWSTEASITGRSVISYLWVSETLEFFWICKTWKNGIRIAWDLKQRQQCVQYIRETIALLHPLRYLIWPWLWKFRIDFWDCIYFYFLRFNTMFMSRDQHVGKRLVSIIDSNGSLSVERNRENWLFSGEISEAIPHDNFPIEALRQPWEVRPRRTNWLRTIYFTTTRYSYVQKLPMEIPWCIRPEIWAAIYT